MGQFPRYCMGQYCWWEELMKENVLVGWDGGSGNDIGKAI